MLDTNCRVLVGINQVKYISLSQNLFKQKKMRVAKLLIRQHAFE